MSLIQSSVIESIIQEKLKGKGKLVALASDLGNLPNGVQNGESHKIIKFKHIGEPVVLVKGESIVTEELQSSETFETVIHIAKGVHIYDYDKETKINGQGQEDIASEQLATVFVRALEKDLAKKLLLAPLKSKCMDATHISSREIEQAISSAFGDDCDTEDFAGIVINSKLAPSFYEMPEFVDVAKTYQTNGNGIVKNGVIGFYRGIPVIMSDITTLDKGECVTYVLKVGAFGYKQVKGYNVEVARNASKKRDELYADNMFVTGILDDTKIVLIRATVA